MDHATSIHKMGTFELLLLRKYVFKSCCFQIHVCLNYCFSTYNQSFLEGKKTNLNRVPSVPNWSVFFPLNILIATELTQDILNRHNCLFFSISISVINELTCLDRCVCVCVSVLNKNLLKKIIVKFKRFWIFWNPYAIGIQKTRMFELPTRGNVCLGYCYQICVRLNYCSQICVTTAFHSTTIGRFWKKN